MKDFMSFFMDNLLTGTVIIYADFIIKS